MDKDRIAGVGQQLIGAVKQVAGKLVGDAKLQADGKTDQVKGKPKRQSRKREGHAAALDPFQVDWNDVTVKRIDGFRDAQLIQQVARQFVRMGSAPRNPSFVQFQSSR